MTAPRLTGSLVRDVLAPMTEKRGRVARVAGGLRGAVETEAHGEQHRSEKECTHVKGIGEGIRDEFATPQFSKKVT